MALSFAASRLCPLVATRSAFVGLPMSTAPMTAHVSPSAGAAQASISSLVPCALLHSRASPRQTHSHSTARLVARTPRSAVHGRSVHLQRWQSHAQSHGKGPAPWSGAAVCSALVMLSAAASQADGSEEQAESKEQEQQKEQAEEETDHSTQRILPHERLTAIRTLWKQQLKDQKDDGGWGTGLSSKEFREFTVKIDAINHDTYQLRFVLPHYPCVVDLPPVSHFIVKVEDSDGVEHEIKLTPYVSHNGFLFPFLDFIVKDTDANLLTEIDQNAKLKLKGPFQTVDIETTKPTHVAMVAKGVGISPMFQLLHRYLDDDTDDTRFSLVVHHDRAADRVFDYWLEELEQTFPNHLQVHRVLGRPIPDWKGGVGAQLTAEHLEDVLQPSNPGSIVLLGRTHNSSDQSFEEFVAHARGLAQNSGYAADNIFEV